MKLMKEMKKILYIHASGGQALLSTWILLLETTRTKVLYPDRALGGVFWNASGILIDLCLCGSIFNTS
jgi:hypothetical protein